MKRFWTGVAWISLLLGSHAHAQAASNEAWQVSGLQAPADIIVDRWGLAHIYAGSQRDAYFLQGYNAARDRLWQIDLWRKRGLGLLSASFGPSYVKQDRAARLFLYRGDMAAEWARYAPGSEDRYTAFVAGINAYVGEVLKGTKPLPIEFGITKSRPDYWQASDVVRIRSGTLVTNSQQEVRRARSICAGGLAADRLRFRIYPDHDPVQPKGLDLCSIPANVLDDYVLATAPVRFSAAVTAARDAEGPPDGSNNWVIAGSRTTTGHPILANDPHRTLLVPSLRYVVHLEAPGLSIIGAGEPSVPGVSFGHNRDAAFGLTIFGVDQEDMYVYETRPGHPNAYRYRGRWEKMRVVRENIPVKDGASVPVELLFSRHGPVIHVDPAQKRAYALRTVWSEPGASGYAAASWLAGAATWQDFRTAADHWGAPPLNLVWADKSGATGWIAAGLTPVRRNWDGLLPVPGDGRYEWQGFLPPQRLPSIKDPAQGWIATNNELNLPKDYPADVPIGFEWADYSRANRVAEVFSTRDRFSIADTMALQNDKRDMMALRLVKLLDAFNPADADAKRAVALLKAWDGDLSITSVPATIAETWMASHLGRVLAKGLPAAAQSIVNLGSADAALHILETRDPLFNADPATILSESLTATLADLRERLGPDMDQWQWGRLHTVTLKSAVAPLADEAQRKEMTIGPEPIGGSGTTLALAASAADFKVFHGPSVKIVMDVGDWDKSMFMNMPGQSDDPTSPHYRDFFPGWQKGLYAPLSYSRAAVDQAAERIIHLTPGK